MRAIVPNRLEAATVFDVEHLNENLRAIARDVNDVLARDYVYSVVILDLSGLADTDGLGVRKVPIRARIGAGASGRFTLIGAELIVYSATGATWTATCSNTAFPTLSVATAGATTEARDTASQSIELDSSSDVTFTLAATAASTITGGRMILYLRSSRTPAAAYVPAQFDAADTDIKTALETEIATIATKTESSDPANECWRIEGYRFHNLAAAVTLRLPDGQRKLRDIMRYIAATAGRSVTIDLTVNGTTTSASVAGTGVGNLVTGTSSVSASTANDPTDTTDDILLTFTPAGGTVQMAEALITWEA